MSRCTRYRTGALRARLDNLAGWRAGPDHQLQPRPGRGQTVRYPPEPTPTYRHALLDFLASRLSRRKSQHVWPSEAAWPRRARRENEEK
jgi:hypothetical protein